MSDKLNSNKSKSKSKNKSKSKILNPYNKKLIPVIESKGRRLKKLVEKCKACSEDKIYDIEKHICVKRTPANLKKLHEFDKFCKKYKVEKIKQKDTDKLFFGKFLNMSLPGGVKVKDIVGKTKAKEIAYDIEKEHDSKLKQLKTILPIGLFLGGILFSYRNYIYDKIKQFPGKDSKIGKLLINIMKSKNIPKILRIKINENPENVLLKTNTQLPVNVADNVTKEYIEKEGIGDMSDNTDIINVNTKTLGINGVLEYRYLLNYSIKYNTTDQTLELRKYTRPTFNSFTGITTIARPVFTSMSSSDTKELLGIVVDNNRKQRKINDLKIRYKIIETDIESLKDEYNKMLEWENQYKEIIDLKSENRELEQKIALLNTEATSNVSKSKPLNQSLVKEKDTNYQLIESNLKKINAKEQYINKKFGIIATPENIARHKNENGRNLYYQIIEHYNHLRVFLNNLKLYNINGLYDRIDTLINYITDEINQYNNFTFNEISSRYSMPSQRTNIVPSFTTTR